MCNAVTVVGPTMLNANRVTRDVRRSADCLVPVRHAAAIQDRSFFSTLPPALMHDDYHLTANKLYGGAMASKVQDAAYRQGPFNELKHSDRSINGAAIFEFNGRSYPVLLYTSTVSMRGEKRAFIAHIYDAPLAELEADLFDDRKPVSSLERKWLGEDQAESLHRMRMHMGAHMRASGLATMPGFLLNDDYHLVRGQLPWLHFRGPVTDHEVDLMRNMLVAALAHDTYHGSEPAPQTVAFNVAEKPNTIPYGQDILTVFDRCKQKYAWVPEKVTAQAVEAHAGWRPFYDRMQADTDKVNAMFLSEDALRDTILYLGMSLVYAGIEHYSGEPSDMDEAYGEFPKVELDEVSDMAKQPPAATLHTLTSMVRTCGVVSPTRVGLATFAPNSLEKVAAATFAASDAVLAFRDVDGWKIHSEDHMEHNAITWLSNMAGRIKEPQAMLIIDLDYVYNIKSMRLINSAIKIDIKALGDAARLIACPWVTVVMHRTAIDADDGWFTLDASLVQRDLLQVTNKVRETFGAAPAKPPKPAASPESVEQLRKDINERLEKLEKAVGDVKRQRVEAPQRPLAPAAPPESTTVASLRAAAAVLERLTGARPPAANGGR